MAILKKIQAATLVETLTASGLILIVFLIASLSFNNIFTNHVHRDQSALENRLKELEYLYLHEQLQLPYAKDFEGWEVELTVQKEQTLLEYSKGGTTHQKNLTY